MTSPQLIAAAPFAVSDVAAVTVQLKGTPS